VPKKPVGLLFDITVAFSETKVEILSPTTFFNEEILKNSF
jgi:hypothetical protein